VKVLKGKRDEEGGQPRGAGEKKGKKPTGRESLSPIISWDPIFELTERRRFKEKEVGGQSQAIEKTKTEVKK